MAKVPLDGYLRGTLFSALGKVGVAFGASRSVEWALHDLAHPEGVEDALERFPPNLWNKAERACSPPIVIEVEGQDLRAASSGRVAGGIPEDRPGREWPGGAGAPGSSHHARGHGHSDG